MMSDCSVHIKVNIGITTFIDRQQISRSLDLYRRPALTLSLDVQAFWGSRLYGCKVEKGYLSS